MRGKLLTNAIIFLVLLTVVVIVLSQLESTTWQPTSDSGKEDRLLGIAITMADDNNYDQAFNVAKEAGMQITGLALNWSEFEAKAEKFLQGDFLAFINQYYRERDTSVILVVTPLDNVVVVVPDDLKNLPFDHPVMIARFKKFLDFVLSKLTDVKIHSLLIGSEYDAYLNNDPQKWHQYRTFFKAAKAHIISKRPGIPIGVETTTFSLFNPAKAGFVRSLNAESDIVGVSYYAVHEDMKAKKPVAVHADMARLVEEYRGKPLVFHQYGYPSSSVSGSSEEKQAEFIRETFKAWDQYARQVQVINFTWLHEVSTSQVEQFENFYGFSSPEFKAFLGSLGLRTYKGKDKPAFRALKEEAGVRGW